MAQQKKIERSTWMAEESAWFNENERTLEKQYPGKWIAITGKRLIAVGDSLREVAEVADAEGVVEPLFTCLRAKEYQGVIIIRRAT